MCVGRGGEGGGGGSGNPPGMFALSSRESIEGREEMGSVELSVLRFVTGVVLLGGIGGEGLTGAALALPTTCVSSAGEDRGLLVRTSARFYSLMSYSFISECNIYTKSSLVQH